jgi:hypothetical protein
MLRHNAEMDLTTAALQNHDVLVLIVNGKEIEVVAQYTADTTTTGDHVMHTTIVGMETTLVLRGESGVVLLSPGKKSVTCKSVSREETLLQGEAVEGIEEMMSAGKEEEALEAAVNCLILFIDSTNSPSSFGCLLMSVR